MSILSAPDQTRLDLWLFHARFFKSRSLAVAMVSAGHLRLNTQHCRKPGHTVAPGDILTFPQGDHIRVIRILAPGERRGPAAEAQALYDDLSPPPLPGEAKPAPTTAPGFDGNKYGGGRPSKKDRRILDRAQGQLSGQPPGQPPGQRQGQGDDSTA